MILNTICVQPPRVGWPQLTEELALLNHYPEVLEGQNPIRAWEYGMALKTITEWERGWKGDWPRIADVGGANSHFWEALSGVTNQPIEVIDPACATPDGQPGVVHGPGQVIYARYPAEAWVAHLQRRYHIITCISVIEHLKQDQILPFLRALHTLLAPGGLLVLTTDYWDVEGPDTAHFHWMRERIYTPDTLRYLRKKIREIGFTTFGDTDLTWKGNMVYDYSIVSLAYTKKG